MEVYTLYAHGDVHILYYHYQSGHDLNVTYACGGCKHVVFKCGNIHKCNVNIAVNRMMVVHIQFVCRGVYIVCMFVHSK